MVESAGARKRPQPSMSQVAPPPGPGAGAQPQRGPRQGAVALVGGVELEAAQASGAPLALLAPSPPMSPVVTSPAAPTGVVGGGALSLVHTGGTSGGILVGQGVSATYQSPGPAYLLDLERHTEPFRRRRARAYRTQALVAQHAGHDATWYWQRAEGQGRRFERLMECGRVREVVTTCGACGDVKRKPLTCRHHRICAECRGRRVRQGQARIARTMERYLDAARNKLPHDWTTKFLTLTLPHLGSIEHDVDVLTSSFNSFWKRLREHLAVDRGIKRKMPWLRVLETTTKTGTGHAHLHVLLTSPFVPVPVLSFLWAKSLPFDYLARCPVVPVEDVLDGMGYATEEWQRDQIRRVFVTRRGRNGRPLTHVAQPRVHVEKTYVPVRTGRHQAKVRSQAMQIAVEVSKYLVKDAYEQGGALQWNALLNARIYEALEGHRVYQASKGFWVGDRPPPDCDCGADHTHRTTEIVPLGPRAVCGVSPRGP